MRKNAKTETKTRRRQVGTPVKYLAKGLVFKGPEGQKFAQSNKIAGANYSIQSDNAQFILTVNGQSGQLDRYVCDSLASAKTVAQLIEDGKVLL